MRLVLLVVALVTIATSTAMAATPFGTPTEGHVGARHVEAVTVTDTPRGVFKSTTFWNATVPDNVLFSTETVVKSGVATAVNPTAGLELANFARKADGSSNMWVNYRDYTSRIQIVPAGQPLTPVRFCRSYTAGVCDVPSYSGLSRRASEGVDNQGAYIGGGMPLPDDLLVPNPTDTDSEILLYQPDYLSPDGKQGRIWEAWQFRPNPDYDPSRPQTDFIVTAAGQTAINAEYMTATIGRMVGTVDAGSGRYTVCNYSGCGYKWDVPGHPDSQARDSSMGPTAVGISSIIGGIVSMEDCMLGRIEHQVSVQVPDAHTGYWWPAVRGDGGLTSKVITEGMRLTFPSTDIEPMNLTPLGLAVYRAVRRHGMLVDDRTWSSLNIRVEPGCEGPLSLLWTPGLGPHEQLRNFPWANLRVISRKNADGTPTADNSPNPTAP